MVAGGEGDHETVLLLHQSVHRDALRGEAAGRQHGGVRVQRVPPRALGVLRNVLPHSSFKLVQRAGRHAVANLRGAVVQVADAVQGVVLRMPGGGAHAHAEVVPGSGDPSNGFLVPQCRCRVLGEIGHVPQTGGVHPGASPGGADLWEGAAHAQRGDVVCVHHLHLGRLPSAIHHPPELRLHVIDAGRAPFRKIPKVALSEVAVELAQAGERVHHPRARAPTVTSLLLLGRRVLLRLAVVQRLPGQHPVL
mmetsp:Transcript_19553/g.37733  ORF Transcript_19553/g.37733 Transcript_19553/m.37733 type:complete len:250 (-) Transcript_19553:543-1292(-)